MTNQEFIEKIIHTYVEARELYFGNGGYNITRGMSHSSSGKAEDLFALFMAKNLDYEDLNYLVDKPFSFHSDAQARAKTFKPDLAIVQNNQLTHYFDLKMDLGWNRDIEHYLISKDVFIDELKNTEALWYTMHNGKKNLVISKNLKYQIVILTPVNGNKTALNKNIEIAKGLKNVELYILTDGTHLNMYDPTARERLTIRNDQFDNLLQDTKLILV